MITNNSSGLRQYDDQGRLVYLAGKTVEGVYGIFADTENGLCRHEQCRRYCDKCKPETEPVETN